MIIGEGPGRQEDLTGRPFVGRAGRLLDVLLAHAGLCRTDVYITNIIKDRAITADGRARISRRATPAADAVAGRRMASKAIVTAAVPRPHDRPPKPAEIAACAPWLREQLALVKPRVVVTLGRYSLQAFLPGARIGDVHGRLQRQGGQSILPLYHPSYALHNPGARPVLFRDIEALASLIGARHAAARPERVPQQTDRPAESRDPDGRSARP